jgi:uncharacterized repeat protein (TIGR03803 family)
MLTTVAQFPTAYSIPGNGVTLVQESDGALYGAFTRSDTNAGSIFRLAPNGSLTTLASFYATNGALPYAPILAPDGYFYGITQAGGAYYDNEYGGYGTIYRMDSNGVLTTMLSFDQTNGWLPNCLVLASDGSFYGATGDGGTNFTSLSSGNDGTIFKMTTNGDFTLLVSFNGTNGYGPTSLLQASDGNFYGTTYGSGTNVPGTVFKMTPDGQLTNLAVFYGTNGSSPHYLIQASDGCLYGTTDGGGVTNPPGWSPNSDGVVFKVTTNGDFSVLTMFDGTNGAIPTGLTEISNGVLYCTTELALFGGGGELFQVTTNAALTHLLSFGTSPALPGVPIGPLTKASDGNYYGFAQQPSSGVIYSIRPIQAPVLQPLVQSNLLNLTWNAWAGYSYALMYETNLTGNWNLLSTVTPQTNGMTSFSDPIGPDSQRFYQVILQLP